MRAWAARQEAVRRSEQHALLPGRKAERPPLAGVPSQVLQTVAVRRALAFTAFCRRCAAGATPGSPRLRGQRRSDRVPFPQVPVGGKLAVEAKRGRVMHVGLVKLILHRPLEGPPKLAPISRRRTGKWAVRLLVCGP
jgi:putative transposase